MTPDKDDLVAVVAHLTRMARRRAGQPQDERFALAGPLIADLCAAMDLDDSAIAAEAMQQVAAMERPQ